MINRSRGSAAVCALLASTALAAPALAQSAPAPRFANVDANGVDLTTGLVSITLDEGGIGSGEGAMRTQRSWAQSAGWVDNWSGGLFKATVGGVTKTYVQIGGISDRFTQSGSTYTSDNAQGSTLVTIAGGNLLYTAADGTKINFYPANQNAIVYSCPGASPESCQIPTEITRPNGLRFSLTWRGYRQCLSPPPPGESCIDEQVSQRLQSVASSAGYSFTVSYEVNLPLTGTTPPPEGWFRRTSMNSVGYSYPNSTTLDVTDRAGRTWRLTTDASGRLTGVRRPGSSSDNISYVYGSNGLVTSATTDGVTTTYSRTVSSTTGTMTVTNALSQQNVVTSDLNIGRPTSLKDALNRTTSFIYDANGRLTRTTAPEGNNVQLTYDARGNVTQSRAVAKSGSGLADIVANAAYDATCANVVKCNQPNTTTDPRGNVTNFVYDATHGGVTSVTRPAPTSGAVRPQTRFTYTQVQGAAAPALYPPVNMLTKVSACQTLASCLSAADETRTTATYNSNLLPTTVSSGDGTGTLSATSAMTYDSRGNLLTLDGPLSGTADTTRIVYDAIDRTVGTISPDPDGAGVLKNRAGRTTFRPDGQIDRRERGTTLGQTDADWTAFVSLETVQLGYDANNRPVTQSLAASGTTYALTQLSHDALGRPDCSAVRMNSAAFGSLPASACTPGTQGSFGPDRIAKTIYDAAGQVTQQQVAVGTADVATEATCAYTSNGKLQTLKDAVNNLTTYEYDGFDRLSKTRMPLPTQGSNASSMTDFEQLSYDAASNITSRRLRDTTSIAFTYDALNRATLKNLPGAEPDVTYAYDALSRLTSASQTGNTLTFTYDALSRNLTQVGPQGTVTSAWDIAGRRTQLTYPGSGLFLTYDYLVTNETIAIRENGAASGVGVLATFGYDDLGRRISLTRGNGAVTSTAYDPVSRLATLADNVTGTTNDQSATFSYNPASQIGSVTRTNDAYAWTGHGSGSTASVANGLNQLATIGGAATAHDTKGNLTTDPTTGKGYTYSSENLLTGSTGGTAASLAYDPAMRLYQLTGAATTRFGYDGLAMIAEYNGSNALTKRYVHGPGVDEPLVEYDGATTATKRWLHADERGSIIAISDGGGNVTTINRYDEYGKPQSTNVGRFQYTGQTWLSEIGLYYYKARMYGPHLGRFWQTDPISYDGGINLYAYVGNDPVNWTDPLGLSGLCAGVGGEDIVVCGTRPKPQNGPTLGVGALGGIGSAGSGGESGGGEGEDIVVVGKRPPKPPKSPPPPFIPAGAPAAAENPENQQDFCGSASSPGVPDQIGEVDLRGACAAHDNCYGSPGTRKIGCDVRLGRDVFMACMEATVLVPYCVLMGEAYYSGVLYLGGDAYRDAKRRAKRRSR